MRVTPAMAAGITGRLWTFNDLMAGWSLAPPGNWRGFFVRW